MSTTIGYNSIKCICLDIHYEEVESINSFTISYLFCVQILTNIPQVPTLHIKLNYIIVIYFTYAIYGEDDIVHIEVFISK